MKMLDMLQNVGTNNLKISTLKLQITKNRFRYCGFALALQSKKEKQSQCEDLRYLEHYGEEERIGQMIQEYPNMLLALTWCHCAPPDTPTRPCGTPISTEHQLDNVACACYVGRKGGAAALLHQGCPVTVSDCQVVIATGVTELNVKCGEL